MGRIELGQQRESSTVPGLQEPYEALLHPELTIDITQLSTKKAVGKVLEFVKTKFV